jgi:sulfate/thiosulfate transport system ATP-binding protein
MSIDIIAVSKKFESFTALDKISLQIPLGELTALLGPSGCGKTTLLRIIAGLEVLDEGKIVFYGEDKTTENPRKRRVGFVFQHYALFRHMNVFENVAFGLKVQQRQIRPANEAIKAKVNQLLELVQMEKFARHFPAQLSGGQRQRVALARALAVEPKVLLLDEPFGALDARIRKELRRWLRHLHDQIKLTSIFVTHDQEEAMEVADQVVVMNEGRIEQVGTPEQVYDNPVNAFVYKFLDSANTLRAEVSNGKAWIGEAGFPLPPDNARSGPMLKGYFRPHEIIINRNLNSPASIPVVVKHIQTVGPLVHYELIKSDTGESMIAELNKENCRDLNLRENETVFIEIRNIMFFNDDGVNSHY